MALERITVVDATVSALVSAGIILAPYEILTESVSAGYIPTASESTRYQNPEGSLIAWIACSFRNPRMDNVSSFNWACVEIRLSFTQDPNRMAISNNEHG